VSTRSAVVEVEALTRRFGPLTALDEIGFRVDEGELFGVVGADGAGKTTLLRILAGVLAPTTGDARVLGHSIARTPEAPKSELAYMAQRFGLYEDLTVAENLTFYADLHRVPCADRPERLERLFRFSALEPFRHRLAGNLSGGMKQKLALSCSLIHEPRLLLLDEPTFGVDPISRRELWAILAEMLDRGITVVVSTSYLDEAERCDRVLILDRGSALELDTPARLLASLPGVLLAVETSDPRRARNLLREEGTVAAAELFGDRLHVSLLDRDRWAEGAARLAEAGIQVHSVTAIEPSLEDVFMHRMGGASQDA
jgi:ABC-2 type transport system ATP-binding protein